MKLYQAGEKGKAICHTCSCLVDTTYSNKDVPFSDGRGLARNILVSVCDKCGEVVAIPAQSTPAIKAARAQADRSVEAKLPAVFLDALDLACFQLSPEASTDMRKRVITFYIHKYAQGDWKAKEIPDLLVKANKAFPHVGKVPEKRLSFKITASMEEELGHLLGETHLSRTNLLKSLVFKIKEDVVDERGKKRIPELKSLVFGH